MPSDGGVRTTAQMQLLIDLARTWELAPEAEQWTAENRPTRRLMKASSKERPTRRSITALSPPGPFASGVGYEGRVLNEILSPSRRRIRAGQGSKISARLAP